jgi:hypothetical protein
MQAALPLAVLLILSLQPVLPSARFLQIEDGWLGGDAWFLRAAERDPSVHRLFLSSMDGRDVISVGEVGRK